MKKLLIGFVAVAIAALTGASNALADTPVHLGGQLIMYDSHAGDDGAGLVRPFEVLWKCAGGSTGIQKGQSGPQGQYDMNFSIPCDNGEQLTVSYRYHAPILSHGGPSTQGLTIQGGAVDLSGIRVFSIVQE